nr:TetR/AcrR family transcriptional regulator [Brevundimonas naejangsanensis]
MVLCDVPRPRNANATRQAILEAARERFCAESYDDVGMRDVARDVGVDAALISRYFGSKEDLFVAVLDSCKNGRDLMDGPRDDFGQRLAREIVYGEAAACAPDDGSGRMRGLLILLRSIGSSKAMDVVQHTTNNRFFEPLTQWIGGEDAPVRARLAAGLIMGMAISRELSDGFSNLDEAQKASLAGRMADALQGLVDG